MSSSDRPEGSARLAAGASARTGSRTRRSPGDATLAYSSHDTSRFQVTESTGSPTTSPGSSHCSSPASSTRKSKLAAGRALTPDSAVSTLGEMLNLGTVDPKELYAAMDWLVERQSAIEQRLAKRHLQEHTLVLYDLTSSYVEGTALPARPARPQPRKGTLQIVFGLLCTASGCPVAVEVFEGSTSDPNTVASQVDKIRTRFGLHRVVLVGDRRMLTAARIREDLAEVDGLHWITTLRAPTIRKLVAAGTVTPSLFDQRDLAEVTSEDFPGERLIVCRNPLLAAQRQRKRLELLAATEKELEPIVAATRRPNNPLRGPPPSACASTSSSTTTHSFRTLLADLGTLTANTMRVADGNGNATFTMLTKPTPVQQRSFELLGVTPQV